MRVIVFMQKELEDWWGIDDLLEDNADLSVDEQNALITERGDDLHNLHDM